MQIKEVIMATPTGQLPLAPATLNSQWRISELDAGTSMNLKAGTWQGAV